MATTITIDKAGRVVIPKPLRDKLHMSPGDSFQVEGTDAQIVLRPIREEGRMYKKDGFWVFETGVPITLEETNAVLETIRRERDESNMGLE